MFSSILDQVAHIYPETEQEKREKREECTRGEKVSKSSPASSRESKSLALLLVVFVCLPVNIRLSCDLFTVSSVHPSRLLFLALVSPLDAATSRASIRCGPVKVKVREKQAKRLSERQR